MMMWTLREHGDGKERLWGYKVIRSFPNYEVFWRQHVVPLTCRVVRSDNILLRPSAPQHLSELGTSNYRVFAHLASCHEKLESSQSLAPENLSDFYNHLYSAKEAIEGFHGATRKVLHYYSHPTPTKLERRIGSQLAREIQEIHDRVNLYRATHDASVIIVNGKIPKPDKSIVQKYRSPQSLSRLLGSRKQREVLERDFIDARTQCERDLEQLESLLNRMWEKVLSEFNSMRNAQTYRSDQNNITEEDREFCNPSLYPPSTNSLTIRRSITTGGSINWDEIPEKLGRE